MDAKGLKINISETKAMVSGENHDDVERTWKQSCAVCGKGVRGNLQSAVSTVW